MDALDFSEEEIQEQLAILGYRNIPKHRLHEFKQDLDELIRRGEWKTLSSPKQTDATEPRLAPTQPSPPPYTKEKVSQCYFQGSDEGFFLHPTKTDHESQVHNTSQNRRCEQQQGNRDSYARYSVAPKLQLPSGAPSRRQVDQDQDQDPEDTLHPSFTDSYTSPPDSQGRRLIKRKVLSSLCTHLNRVQVSNMYKMYNAQWEEGSGDDKNCLSSSFWTDEEKQEEEEEIERVVSEDSKAEAKRAEATSEKENGSSDEEGEEIKGVVEEEELKPVDEAEESSQEASEEEKPDMKNQENFTGESSEDGSDEEEEEDDGADDEEGGSDDEEDEEEETEQEVNEDESKLVPKADDPFKEASEEEKPDEEEEEGEEIERVVNEEEAVESSEEEKPDMKNQGNYSEESSEDGSDEMEEEEEGADDEEDGSDEEEEAEGEETEQEFNEEESKLVAKLEDTLQEASEEERLEVKNQENFTTESCEDGSDEEEEEEEEEEIERVVNEDDSKPLAESEEEQPEVKNQENFTRENSKCVSDDDKEEEEGNCTSSCSSPAQSVMTSGYGTYRPEEQEGGDYRDDHTITEFDQDSRGDASEMRDDEEDNRSLCSFGGFGIESTQERGNVQTGPESALENEDQNEPGADGAAWSSGGGRREEEDVTDSENKDVTNERPEGQQPGAGINDGFMSDEKHLENGENPEEGTGSEKPDEEERDVKVEREAEDEDPDESSSNKDIKFIDSKVDFSWMAYDDMEWEGNLRQKKASCLEEGLAELHVSLSTQQDFETENEDVPSHSSEEDRISLSAFESYISGTTESESEYDLRPKPKSFIRPVMNQQNLKKTDPVTKYFQYKQFWEAFKLPGEKDRRALRWEIRERLAHEPPPTKPRRVLVPNTYIVPTEKKRAALRWEIRNDLAHGLLPHKLSH